MRLKTNLPNDEAVLLHGFRGNTTVLGLVALAVAILRSRDSSLSRILCSIELCCSPPTTAGIGCEVSPNSASSR